jgi:hypothetical protein
VSAIENDDTIFYEPIKLTLITFTVGGVEYQAEESMTWEEWVNSEYNPITLESGLPEHIYYIDNGKVKNRYSKRIISLNFHNVTPLEIIQEGAKYVEASLATDPASL